MSKPQKKWIAVFCASAPGAEPEYLDQARELGRRIAEKKYGRVYGGATLGAMGAIADAEPTTGGEVMGVVPDVIMDLEIGHRGLTELHVVLTMHDRKGLAASRADAFIALPSGYGTLDEFIEIVTWGKLRIHAKPCVLVNLGGYYDGLLEFLDTQCGRVYQAEGSSVGAGGKKMYLKHCRSSSASGAGTRRFRRTKP